MSLHIPTILGSAREGRRSERVAYFIKNSLEDFGGIKTEIVDIRGFSFTRTIASMEEDEDAFRWRKIARNADAFFIVTPEYNHGYPGELKHLLDCAYDEYERKPVAFAGVSAGRGSGIRVVEALKLVSIELGMVPINESFYVGGVKESFSESGESLEGGRSDVGDVIEELVWFTSILSDNEGDNKK